MAHRGRFHLGWVLLAAVLVLVALLLARARWLPRGVPIDEARRPDVVLVLIDTLRPDYLALGGYPYETSPFLSGLAERSAVFAGATSTSSWTAPSTASLITSWNPSQHGVIVGVYRTQVLSRRRAEAGQEPLTLNRLPEAIETLPEIFRRGGYHTLGLAANINVGPEIGFDRGFDRFERLHRSPAEEIHARLREWQQEMEDDRPRFLYLHLNDVHEPYHRREPWYVAHEDELEERRARYLSEIGYVDAMLWQLYTEWVEGKDTLFVVMSDHGEEFMDHGSLAHGARLYEELTRILLLIHGPAVGVEPQRFELNVSILDVLPTLLDLSGLPPLTDRAGVSLAPLLRANGGQAELATRLIDRPHFAHRMGENGPPELLWSVMVAAPATPGNRFFSPPPKPACG